MNLRMTSIAIHVIDILSCIGVSSMPFMALETEKWHTGNKKVVIYGAVRTMTPAAVLGIVSMFKYKGPFLFCMALGTGFFYCILS